MDVSRLSTKQSNRLTTVQGRFQRLKHVKLHFRVKYGKTYCYVSLFDMSQYVTKVTRKIFRSSEDFKISLPLPLTTTMSRVELNWALSDDSLCIIHYSVRVSVFSDCPSSNLSLAEKRSLLIFMKFRVRLSYSYNNKCGKLLSHYLSQSSIKFQLFEVSFNGN